MSPYELYLHLEHLEAAPRNLGVNLTLPGRPLALLLLVPRTSSPAAASATATSVRPPDNLTRAGRVEV